MTYLSRAPASGQFVCPTSSTGSLRMGVWICGRITWLLGLLCFILWSSGGKALAADAVVAVVVRPSGWAKALEHWKQYRQEQGYEIVELDSELGRDAARQEIVALAAQHKDKLQYVLLAADANGDPAITIPAYYHPSKAMVQFGGDKTLATDVDYGDVDFDGSPDLAIGRIPADSPEQLHDALERVIQYEQLQNFSSWRRDVHVVAGVGGFGMLADSIIEMTTRRFLADRIPGWSKVSMTQASVQSHYCPDPFQFDKTCVARLNQGGMFWVYIGHGHVQTLDSMRFGQQFLPILNNEYISQIDTREQPPVAIFLACYTGAYDASSDSLAEELVMSGTGPIAALAASRVSGPYGLAMLSDGLLSHCFEDPTETLGLVILKAKKRLLRENLEPVLSAGTNEQLSMIQAIAQALSPTDYDLYSEHTEHVWEMNLLGDPMLRLSYPEQLEVAVATQAAPGSVVEVRGQTAHGGNIVVELAYRRGQVRRELDALAADPNTKPGRTVQQQRYEKVNDDVIASVLHQHTSGEFVIPLQIPDDVTRGKYCIRVFHEQPHGWGVGYAEISVRPPRN